ncbi:hypothetical protein XPA_010748 [Xanthoria parietina]
MTGFTPLTVMSRAWSLLLTTSFLFYVAAVALPRGPALSLYAHDDLKARGENTGNSTAKVEGPILRLPNNMPRIVCDGDRFRRDLRWGACLDAVNTIPSSSALLTFKQRGPGRKPDVPLPWRYISAGGSCIVDVATNRPGHFGTG